MYFEIQFLLTIITLRSTLSVYGGPDYAIKHKSILPEDDFEVNKESFNSLMATGCLYDEDKDDVLRSVDKFFFPPRLIYFAEMSCEGTLSFRQACSVESAAKAHPDRQVNVFFAVPVTKRRMKKRPFTALSKYSNIKFYRIHVNKFGKGTPLESLMSIELQLSNHFVFHLTDIVRFLTLYKFGGIFLDLDVIVVKSFDTLPASKRNFVGKHEDETFGTEVLSISKDRLGRRLADKIIKILSTDFEPYETIENGKEAYRKAMSELLHSGTMRAQNTNGCYLVELEDTDSNLTIYDTKYFYPVNLTSYFKYFELRHELYAEEIWYDLAIDYGKVYTAKMWDLVSKSAHVTKSSLYMRLAERHCPETLKLYNFTKKEMRLTEPLRCRGCFQKVNGAHKTTFLGILGTPNCGPAFK